MLNIITLITLLITTFTPQGLKPVHLQEYDLVGEIPEIIVMAQRPTEKEMRAIGIMPEVVITAEKNKDNIGILPTIEVYAQRPSQEEMRSVGVMPEVVITANRYQPGHLDVVHDNQKSKIGGKDV